MLSKVDLAEQSRKPIPRPVNEREIPPGYAIAAYLSAMIGLLTLAVANFLTTASKAFEAWVHQMGKAWMPGAQGIGPYSGKETLALVAWLLSWAILHFAFGKRLRNEAVWLTVFLVGIGMATTLLWPPVTHWLWGGER